MLPVPCTTCNTVPFNQKFRTIHLCRENLKAKETRQFHVLLRAETHKHSGQRIFSLGLPWPIDE
jgi:hypothetical protein